MRLGLCKVRQRTGLWETGVPGPQRGGETSFEATQKTERVRPMGTMGSSQIQPVVFHRGSARESGGGSRAGRMVHHRFVTVALDKLHLPFGCVTPSPVTLMDIRRAVTDMPVIQAVPCRYWAPIVQDRPRGKPVIVRPTAFFSHCAHASLPILPHPVR